MALVSEEDLVRKKKRPYFFTYETTMIFLKLTAYRRSKRRGRVLVAACPSSLQDGFSRDELGPDSVWLVKEEGRTLDKDLEKLPLSLESNVLVKEKARSAECGGK